MMRSALLVLLLGCIQIAQAQSPWVRSKAGLYAQLGYHFIPTYETIFDSDGGDRDLERELSERTVELYAEYGITSKTTIVLNLPYRFYSSGDLTERGVPPQTTSGDFNGIGNTTVSVRQLLLDGRMPLTATAQVSMPADQYDDLTGISLGYDAWTFTPMLSTGMGYNDWYWFTYGGYGFRTNDFSDQLNMGAEAGISFGPVWLISFVNWIQPMRNGTVQLPPRNELTGLFVNNQGYVSTGIKVLVEVDRFAGAFLSLGGAASGQLVPQNPGIGLGGYFRWD